MKSNNTYKFTLDELDPPLQSCMNPIVIFRCFIIFLETHYCRFYVDDIPIREIRRRAAMKHDFPSKPMSIYSTIWDASNWATNGGKYKVDYRYAPYVSQFSDLVLHGCAVDPIEKSRKCDDITSIDGQITSLQRIKMANFRNKYLTYSYCYDQSRYKIPPSECVIDSREANRLKRFDPVTFGGESRRHHGRHHHRSTNNDEKASI